MENAKYDIDKKTGLLIIKKKSSSNFIMTGNNDNNDNNDNNNNNDNNDNNDKDNICVINDKTTNIDLKKQKKQKKNRCYVCNKKTGLLPFTCKCNKEKLFCSKHRIPEEHNCTFDWKKETREKLEKENPQVIADKFGGNKIN